jgi:hypothetical protein
MQASWHETMPRAVTMYIFSQGLIYNSVLFCKKRKKSVGIFLQMQTIQRIQLLFPGKYQKNSV